MRIWFSSLRGNFFYRGLLPTLKRLDKTIVVISQHDRYFDSADRIVRLEDGKIVEEQPDQSQRPGGSAGEDETSSLM